MIYWTAFSWEAFATLVTGLAAVFAAYRVGQRQTAIQKNQVSLKEQGNKIALLERRLKVYEAVHTFIIEAIGSLGSIPAEKERDFKAAKLHAQFILSETIDTFLNEVWTKKCELRESKNWLQSNPSQTGPQRAAHSKTCHDTLLWFQSSLKTLDELFSDITPVK